MEIKASDRLGSRLLALNLRLAELDHQMRRTHLDVLRLENQYEEARLARMLDAGGPDPAEIAPVLEKTRVAFEDQREVVDRVRQSQWKARVEYTVLRARERREARAAELEAESGELKE
jgi:hypothetical protein